MSQHPKLASNTEKKKLIVIILLIIKHFAFTIFKERRMSLNGQICFPKWVSYFKLPSHNSLNKQAKTGLIYFATDQTKGSK